jgi:hypothetical protein
VTTVAYGMSDLAGSTDGRVGPGTVNVSGGCGQQHQVQVDGTGRPHVECELCAPILVGRHWGWAASPAGVPPTPDEVAARELAEREGTAATNIMLRSVSDALAKAAASQLGAGTAPAAVSLLDQLKALGPGEREALLNALGAPPAGGAELPSATAGKPAGQGRGRTGTGKAGGQG